MNRSALIAVAVLAALALGLGGRYLILGGGDDQDTSGTAVETSALVGGPFTMIDHDGAQVTQADYTGRFMIVYFGYTFCPDVCPLGLQVIGDALDIFAEKGGDLKRIAPLFVTVDPERDTPEILKEYLSNFHPGLRGLGGSIEQLTQIARAYRVYYAKVKDETSSADYLMDHTAITYLMGTDGGYIGHFSHNVTPEEMSERLLKMVN
jgi:protein SCO1/2